MKNTLVSLACIAVVAVSTTFAQETSKKVQVPPPAKEQSKNHEDPNYGWSPGRVPTAKEIAEVEKLVAANQIGRAHV